MRIIGGTARGRRLATPRDMRVRPTADRVKEAIFNILNGLISQFTGCRVLDVFAGTGNLGIEALSRGASSAVFIENNRQSAALVARNLQSTGFGASSRIIQKDAVAALKTLTQEGLPFNLIFLDPPYEKGLLEQSLDFIGNSSLVNEESIVVGEHSVRESIACSFGSLRQFDRRIYRDTAVSFLASSIPDLTSTE